MTPAPGNPATDPRNATLPDAFNLEYQDPGGMCPVIWSAGDLLAAAFRAMNTDAYWSAEAAIVSISRMDGRPFRALAIAVYRMHRAKLSATTNILDRVISREARGLEVQALHDAVITARGTNAQQAAA